jgi:2-epi-5-epi-valiolone synthase
MSSRPLNLLQPLAPRHAATEPIWTFHAGAERRQTYEVVCVTDLLGASFAELTHRLTGRSGLLVATPTVADLYGHRLAERIGEAGLSFPLLVLDGGEGNKTIAQVEAVCATAFDRELDRTSLLLALGGGVCSDIVSTAASWIRRGIGTARIPTTLVGQVDAAIGIKGGANFRGRKSAVGCFYAPEWVLVDPSFLTSLPPAEIRAGFAEIVKMALIRDVGLFELVEEFGAELVETRFRSSNGAGIEIIRRSIAGMLAELAPNIYEDRGYRRSVDLGHVFSPLVEAASGYRITHGEAVAMDIALTASAGSKLGLLDPDLLARILALFERLGLPMTSPYLSDDLLDRAVSESIKHRGGTLNLVVPTDIGKATIVTDPSDCPMMILRQARDELATRRPPVLRARSRGSLVYDIGGTNVRVAVFEAGDTHLRNVRVAETPSRWAGDSPDPSSLYDLLLEMIVGLGRDALRGAAPAAVGIAFPGPVTPAGTILAAPTLWGPTVRSLPDLRADLRRTWPQAEITLLNDVTAAGYRYVRKADEDFCVVTVSSGIGNKVFLRGTPVLGPNGRGGELGHVCLAEPPGSAVVCECGGRGHVGAISSGRGTLLHAIHRAAADPTGFTRSQLGRETSAAEGGITNEAIVRAFLARDAWTRELIRETSRPLARALASLHASIGLERFVVIGGFALALGEEYRLQLVRHAEEAFWNVGQCWEEMIELGADDDLAGLTGMARYINEFKGRARRCH